MNIKIGYEKEKTQETAVLTLRAENDPHETVRHSCRTVGRLFRTAQFLPEGERLGWRFCFSPDGAFRCTAFASSGAQATCEDLAWIFRDSADTAPDDGVQPEEGEKSRCYADKNSDLEDSSIWEASVASVNLSGKKRDDVIEIAKSQLGYAGKGSKTLRKSRRYRSPTTPCALNRCTSRSLFSSPRYLFSLRSC